MASCDIEVKLKFEQYPDGDLYVYLQFPRDDRVILGKIVDCDVPAQNKWRFKPLTYNPLTSEILAAIHDRLEFLNDYEAAR